MWQDAWLAKLRGAEAVRIAYGSDFPEVSAADWPEVRKRFVEGLNSALAIARAEPYVHHARDDDHAAELLLKIVNHGAYHMGQVSLLKRLLRLQTEDQDRATVGESVAKFGGLRDVVQGVFE